MSDEALDTLRRYFGKPNEIHFCGNKNTAQKVWDCISFGKKYSGDIPDLAVIHNGSCLLIEHFEFDCYKNISGGSQNKIEQARIGRAFNKVDISDSETLLHEEIHGESSYQLYINNVSSMFIKHYERIDAYKRNLMGKGIITPTMPIKMAFLIEDSSPLGTAAYNEAGPIHVSLAKSREFLSLMRRSPDVDFVIACAYDGANNIIWLISQDSLDEYDKKAIDYAHMGFVDYTPQFLGFKSTISRDKVEEP